MYTTYSSTQQAIMHFPRLFDFPTTFNSLLFYTGGHPAWALQLLESDHCFFVMSIISSSPYAPTDSAYQLTINNNKLQLLSHCIA